MASIIMPCPLLMDNRKCGHGLLKETRPLPPKLNWTPLLIGALSDADRPSTFLYDCAFSATRMLEITPDDIALLSDTELRTLIGLLCEAELRNRGLSAAAVTWSGHQNSADGGLDVRVALAEGETIEGFVPSVDTRVLAIEVSNRPGVYLDGGNALRKPDPGPGEVRDLGDVKAKPISQ